MKKIRIDILLVELGLAESRAQAQRLVMAGQVRVDGQIAPKPSSSYPRGVTVEIAEKPRYVSRGGDKLQAALDVFEVGIMGKICADVGASTGGFTDCLLQHGAQKVYAIDVGKGILHWKLRQDPRVLVMEETNARYLDGLPENPGLITIDASFISLKLLLPVINGWFAGSGGEVVVLIKPQFEAGRAVSAKGDGVIRDSLVHRQILSDLLEFAEASGFGVQGLIRSPLLGPKGNVEFLAHLKTPQVSRIDLVQLIDRVIPIDESRSSLE
jgi:23S rRNA (cytidine1920-2'-O)/16S rRNA (cytidine1409-2'-O)-methyltransferase